MSYSHQHNDSVSSTTSSTSASSTSTNAHHTQYSSSPSSTSTWVNVTIIEDDDLMFGGKPLSTWYEEDRRCSVPSDENETENGDALSPCSSAASTEEDRGRRRDRR